MNDRKIMDIVDMVETLALMSTAIVEALAASKEGTIPSDHIYSALCSMIPRHVYDLTIDSMIEAGMIARDDNRTLSATDKGREWIGWPSKASKAAQEATQAAERLTLEPIGRDVIRH